MATYRCSRCSLIFKSRHPPSRCPQDEGGCGSPGIPVMGPFAIFELLDRKQLNDKIRYEIFARDGFTCQRCGRHPTIDKVKLHCDHIKPVSRGGHNDPDNLQTLCEFCNRAKGNMTEVELKNQGYPIYPIRNGRPVTLTILGILTVLHDRDDKETVSLDDIMGFAKLRGFTEDRVLEILGLLKDKDDGRIEEIKPGRYRITPNWEVED